MSNAILSVLGLYNVDNTIFDNMTLPVGMDKQTVIDAIIQDCMELEILYPNPDALKVMIGIWAAREKPTFERVYRAELAEYDPIENYNRHQTDTREIEHSGDDVTVSNRQGQNSGSSSGEAGTTTNSTGREEKTINSTGQAGTTTNASGQLTDNNLHKYAAFDSGTLADQTRDERSASSSNNQTEKSDTTNKQTEETTTTNNQTEQSANTQSHTDNITENARNTLTHGENVGETFTSYIHGNIGVTTSQQMLESELTLAPKINTINYIVNSFKMRFCILVY